MCLILLLRSFLSDNCTEKLDSMFSKKYKHKRILAKILMVHYFVANFVMNCSVLFLLTVNDRHVMNVDRR